MIDNSIACEGGQIFKPAIYDVSLVSHLRRITMKKKWDRKEELSVYKPYFWLGYAVIFLLVVSTLFACQKEIKSPEFPRLQSLYVSMRDGVKIAIDVWLPAELGSKEKIPAMMYCTRYWRASDIVDATLEQDTNYSRANMWNGAGYALVLVDARGTGASFGSRAYEMTIDEVKDYGEIAGWIVNQAWSNGKIGAYGVSYPGNTAEMLMVNRHTGVKAVAPLFNDFNYYDHLVEPGGVQLNFFINMWGGMVMALDNNDICAAQGISGDPCEELRTKIRGVKPVDADSDRKLLSEAVLQHQGNIKLSEEMNEFRDDPSGPEGLTNIFKIANPSGYVDAIEESKTAIFVRVGWLDAGTANGALSRFLTVKNPQKVIIGPWSHGGGFHTDPFLPPDTPTQPSLQEQTQEMILFFDQFLKDNKTPQIKSTITYYTMGAGTWSVTEVWPPDGFTKKNWYLGPKNLLSQKSPKEQLGSDSYTVNYETTTGQSNRWYTQMGGPDVVYPDRAEEDKKLLTYTSEPLETEIEITGHPIVTLHVSSTATDGAFFVYLEDVDEEGKVTYITEGQLRAMCRKEAAGEPPFMYFGPLRTYKRLDASPLTRGEIVELTFDLFATSVVLKKGHRIRIAIAGADRDSFARYPLDNQKVPTVQIERNKKYPSKIELPIKVLQADDVSE
jgi:putative CocE/NonD family hydrolase